MLNLLISILGDSFDRFKESQKSLDYKEMLDVIIEFESLMFWARNTGKRTYLQKCDYYKKSEKENNKALEPAQNLQNELESLKRQLSENYKEKSEQIKKEVNERITEKIESLDKKFLAIERQMQNQESRINEKLQQILDALKFPA